MQVRPWSENLGVRYVHTGDFIDLVGFGSTPLVVSSTTVMVAMEKKMCKRSGQRKKKRGNYLFPP